MQTQTSRTGRPPAPPMTHDGLLRDLLSADELMDVYAPLARDYRAAIVLSAGLGFRDRARVLRRRLDAYAAALREALDTAKDDATTVLRGPRAWGGRR